MSASARADVPGACPGLARGTGVSGLLAALAVAASVAPAPARTATIALSARPGCLFELSGQIEPGDAERFRALAAQHWQGIPAGQTEDNADTALCLDSPGGSFQEGHDLSLVVHDRALATRVTAGARCLSACSLVFMAGRVRGAENDGTRRILDVGGRLGFHAPFTNLAETGTFTGKDVNDFVPGFTGMIAEFIRQAAFRSTYQAQPSISLGLLAEMLDTPRDAMFMIDTVDRAARWGIDLDGVGGRRPFGPGDAAQLCENQVAWLYDREARRLTADDFSHLEIGTTEVAMYPEPRAFIEVTDDGLSTRICSVQVPMDGEDYIGFCLSDGYTGVGLGDCDTADFPYAIWVPWWHGMPPDLPLSALR